MLTAKSIENIGIKRNNGSVKMAKKAEEKSGGRNIFESMAKTLARVCGGASGAVVW